ncbi:MAG: EAL domain-containing protein, partial [Acidimicrobiia bacterium]
MSKTRNETPNTAARASAVSPPGPERVPATGDQRRPASDQRVGSDEFLHAVLAAMRDCLIVLDPVRDERGRITNATVRYQNEASKKMWGERPAGSLLMTDEQQRPAVADILTLAWEQGPQHRDAFNDGTSGSPWQVAYVEWRRIDDLIVAFAMDRTQDQHRNEELDRFRDVVAALDEAIYVYAPMFDDAGEIVDLRVLEQNAAAVAQPGSSVTRPNMLASEGFRVPELAVEAARQAWRTGRAEPYLLAVTCDNSTTLHYEITTLRAGNLLVQVSVDRTPHHEVEQARQRYRRTLESLEQAVVVFHPVWLDDQVVDASIDYFNAMALRLVPTMATWSQLSTLDKVGADLIQYIGDVAISEAPRQVLVENPGNTRYPLLAPEVLELAFYPDGDWVIAVATDRTETRRAERERRAMQALLEQGIAHLVEPFIVLEPVLDGDVVVDARLTYANNAATDGWAVPMPIGSILSEYWTRFDDFLHGANEAWSGGTARYRIDTFADPLPELLPTVDDVTIVRAAEQLVVTSNNRTAEIQALNELAASEARFRSTADALVQQMHVHQPIFDDAGNFVDTEIVYANPAAEAAIPQSRPHAGKRGTALFFNFTDTFETLYSKAWVHPDAPASVVVDNLDGAIARMPSTYLEVQARRMGDQIVTVAVDRGVEMRAVRALQRSRARLQEVFEEMALAEERFRTAVETMSDPLLLLDDHGGADECRIIYANRAAAALLGRPWEFVRDILIAEVVDDPELARVLTDTSPGTVAVHLIVEGGLRTFDVSRTASGVRRVAVLRDVSVRDEEAARLDQIATHDSQTGLPNRRLLDRHLHERIAASSETARSVAVVVIEIDEVEAIRRSLGYRVADRILDEMVRRLRAHAPGGSFVAGLSTTSFAVVLADVMTSTDVVAGATELVRALARPVDVGGTTLHVGATAGISFAPLHGRETEALVMRAKTAAWTAARQQTAALVWQPDADLEASRRVQQLGEIDRALSNGEMFLEYQPKIELATGRLVSAEALVRWNHPQRGLVAPSEFIADVEQSALAIPFTAWTLRVALSTWLAHADELPQGSRVAVNLPARLVGNPGLIALIEDALVTTAAPAELLELEITERGLVASEEIVW